MQISKEYLAGFMDGEGCIKITDQWKKGKNYPHYSILLSQSGDKGKEILLAIQKQYGGNFYQHLKPGQHKATKAAYKVYWNKQEGIKLLELLIPYLILKQQDAVTVYNYLTRGQNDSK